MQKHQAFEAEVQANAGAIIKLDETGNLMISEGHFASETIRVRHTFMKIGSVYQWNCTNKFCVPMVGWTVRLPH